VQAANPEKQAEAKPETQQGFKFWPLVIVLAALVIAAVLLLVYILIKR
jgi:hypothetical protein